MLYPRFIQMILDEKHPEFVKGPNVTTRNFEVKTVGFRIYDFTFIRVLFR
ncbi:hypothetical protein Hanom_Chr14g01270791 [Helianthus anomalus]